MVFTRCAIVADATSHLKKAVTIAVRYSVVRRQVRNFDPRTCIKRAVRTV